MRQLIEAIRTRDFSLQYSLDHLRGEERNLAEQINEVVNEFRETTLRQEAKYQYFGTMLDTINAFLIVADEQGKVHWMIGLPWRDSAVFRFITCTTCRCWMRRFRN